MHKKQILLAALFAFSFNLFSQETYSSSNADFNIPDSNNVAADTEDVPTLLNGIWQNRQRYIIFNTGYYARNSSSIPQVVLRTFYTWWDDRAQEAEQYTTDNRENFPRAKNNTTQKSKAEEIQMKFVPLTDELFLSGTGLEVQKENFTLSANGQESGAWDIQIKYPGIKETYHVPVCVIGNRLYLDFVVKNISSEEDFSTEGFWQDYGASNGILISPPVTKTELLSYYITEDAVYHIRYWRTDMDYDSEANAVFSDASKNFIVPKHLKVGSETYTCVTGRRTKIRNIEKSYSLPKSYTMNSVQIKTEDETFYGSTICALGEPYLTLTDGTRTLEEIVKLENSRRKPVPAPLFPAKGLAIDFDFSFIEHPPKDYNRRVIDLGK